MGQGGGYTRSKVQAQDFPGVNRRAKGSAGVSSQKRGVVGSLDHPDRHEGVGADAVQGKIAKSIVEQVEPLDFHRAIGGGGNDEDAVAVAGKDQSTAHIQRGVGGGPQGGRHGHHRGDHLVVGRIGGIDPHLSKPTAVDEVQPVVVGADLHARPIIGVQVGDGCGGTHAIHPVGCGSSGARQGGDHAGGADTADQVAILHIDQATVVGGGATRIGEGGRRSGAVGVAGRSAAGGAACQRFHRQRVGRGRDGHLERLGGEVGAIAHLHCNYCRAGDAGLGGDGEGEVGIGAGNTDAVDQRRIVVGGGDDNSGCPLRIVDYHRNGRAGHGSGSGFRGVGDISQRRGNGGC